MSNLELNLRLRCSVKHSDASNLYVSSCPALGIKSQGRTIDEAKVSLVDSMRLFLVHCWKRGIISEVLHRRGFEPCSGTDIHDASERISFNDPVVADANADEEWEGSFVVPFHLLDAIRSNNGGDGRWPA